MRRRFRITVEGKTYEVEVEEVGGKAVIPSKHNLPKSPLSEVVSISSAEIYFSGEVLAPAPGKVLKVSVKPGDTVRAGDELMVFESMKIETRIDAPVAGTVKEVRVKPGDTVKTRDIMIMIQPD